MSINRFVVGILRSVLGLTLFALGSSPGLAHASALWVSGAEIQDYQYEADTSNNAGFDTTTKRSGAASFVLHSGTLSGAGTFTTPTFNATVTNGTTYVSAWVYIPSNACPVGTCTAAFMIVDSSLAVFKINDGTDTVTFFNAGTQIGSGYTITTNAWHLFEVKITTDATSTADDTIEGRIDGEVRASQTTSSVNTGTNGVRYVSFLSPNLTTTHGPDMFVDDIIVTDDEYVGLDGHVITRTADGTGAYGAGSAAVAFSGCASYQSCWSEMPVDGATTSANDGTGNFAKFTATIGDFSSGTDAIGVMDTVFGCRGTWSMAKGTSGITRDYRMTRRVDGTDTYMPPTGAGVNLGTSFQRYDDLECTFGNCGPWGACDCPPCTDALDGVELGGFRDYVNQARLMRISATFVTCGYRSNEPIYIHTVSGTQDVGPKAENHNQSVPEGLPAPVLMSNCTGTTQQTCDLCANATGFIFSVAPAGLACLVTTGTGPFTGSITFTGDVSSVDALTLTSPQKIDIHSAQSPPDPPCPTCSGAGLGDSGTCDGGPNDGQPCVVDGEYGANGNTSASCPPTAASRITTMFPALTTTSTGNHSLAATFNCSGLDCHCSGQTDPNDCGNDVCSSDETCSDDNTTACFPDPIVRDGSTSPLTVAGVGCIPATGSGAINSIIGLPGPVGVSLEVEVSETP